MSEVFLSIDQGGQSSRVIAFDVRGRSLGSAAVPVRTTSTGPGRFEQDPEALVGSILSALGEVADALPTGVRVRAGLATQRSSIACWDRITGQALTPVLSWRDTRNAPWLSSLGLDETLVRRITGLRPSAHYGASKLRWCLDHYPDVGAALDQGRLAWGPLASFLIFRLTRERTLAADPANASRTLLMDLGTRDWSAAMTGAFGLPTAALPPIVPENSPFGTLSAPGRSIPLVRCTGDQPAALFADGAPNPFTAFVNAGTGAFALQQANWPNAEERLLTSVIRADDGVSFALEGTVNGAGAALQAEAQALGVGDWAKAVSGVRPSVDLPIFLNGHSGLGSPWWRESFRSRYVGDGTPAARLAAVFDSIVFMLAVNLEAIRERIGRQSSIRVSGGLSLADGLCQGLADLTKLPVGRPATVEATARGLAWLGTSRHDEWGATEMLAFRPGPNPPLQARFERWRGYMDSALADDDV
jgi:glycerol kinase